MEKAVLERSEARHTGPGAGAPPSGATFRSTRDVEILRSLAARIHPRDAGAHNNLGVVFFQKGLFDDAITAFEHALDLDPRMQVAQRNLQIAYFQSGRFETLISETRERLAAEPDDRAARLRLARTYRLAGDAKAARAELMILLDTGPTADTLLELARAERELGQVDAATSRLQQAVALDPGDARAHLELGEVYYQRGLPGEAKIVLERAAELEPDLADAYHLLAFTYGELKDSERAEKARRRAVELNPSFTKSEPNLSLDRYSFARYDELVGDRVQRPEPTAGALVHYNLGTAFRQRGLLEEALREYDLALNAGEDAFLVRQARAEVLLLTGGEAGDGNGEAASAAALYDTLLEEQPDSPKLWNERGVAAHQAGALDDAESAYRTALKLDPEYALAWNNLGVARHHAGESATAEQAFREALRRGRAPGDVSRNLALTLSRTGKHDAALAAYRTALELEPESAPGWSGLGAFLLESGRVREARAALARAVELDPELAEARYQLAFALSAAGDYRGALRETQRALELDPYFPSPRFRLLIDLQFEDAEVLAPELDVAERLRAGEPVEAFEFESGVLSSLFGESAGQDGPDAPGGAPATRAAEREDRPPAGATASGPSPASLLEQARAALARGRLEEAATKAQRAASAGGGPDTLVVLGEAFLRRELAGEALERFEAVLAVPSGEDRSAASRRSALLGRMRSLLMLGRMAEARTAAAELERVDDGDAEILHAVGRTMLQTGESDRAVRSLERAMAHTDTDPDLLTDLGHAYYAAGDLPAAETALGRALAHDADAVRAYLLLGKVRAAGGRPAEASSSYRSALERLPSFGEAALALAELEWATGRRESAIAVLVDLLTVDPYHLECLRLLAAFLERAGRRQEAAQAYDRVLGFDAKDEFARAAAARLTAASGARVGEKRG